MPNTRSHSKSIAKLAIILAASSLFSGCSTPPKLNDAQLESLQVRIGANYWSATDELRRIGYSCYVTGAKRENFDCTKTTGFFPTCLLRVTLIVNSEGKIISFRARDPACIGTP